MASADAAVRSGSMLVTRAGVLGAGVGVLLGGLAGTFIWPVVLTFYGGLAGGVLGLVVGVALGLLLVALSGLTVANWASRLVSGVVIAVADFVLVPILWSPMEAPHWATITLLAIGAALGPPLGPLIVHGFEFTRPAGARSAAEYLLLILLWGIGCGLALGGVSGAVLTVASFARGAGALSELFAPVEGAILGGMSGLVLGVMAAAAAAVSRLRPRA